MRHPRLAATCAATAAVLALSACDAEEPSDTTTLTAPPGVESPPEEEPLGPEEELEAADPLEEEADFPADLRADTAEASDGASLSPIDLRTLTRDDLTRVALDLVGEGLPGWRAEYVDSPTQGASGEAVEVAGEVFLEVVVTGLAAPGEEGAQEYDGAESVTPDEGGVVQEVAVGAVDGGEMRIVLGLSEQVPFRVYQLEAPRRVVVDVQHP